MELQSILEVLAHEVRTRRKAKGISQEGLAELCGLHRTFVGGIERAERNITMRTLLTLAVALECSPVDLIGGDSELSG